MVEATRVWTIDPLSGTEETVARESFVAEWDPTIIWVATDPGSAGVPPAEPKPAGRSHE
jgi:hypothetical protein